MANYFKTQEQRENWNKYNSLYSKAHYKAFTIKLNLEKDKDIIEYINKTGLNCKELFCDAIREYMINHD